VRFARPRACRHHRLPVLSVRSLEHRDRRGDAGKHGNREVRHTRSSHTWNAASRRRMGGSVRQGGSWGVSVSGFSLSSLNRRQRGAAALWHVALVASMLQVACAGLRSPRYFRGGCAALHAQGAACDGSTHGGELGGGNPLTPPRGTRLGERADQCAVLVPVVTPLALLSIGVLFVPADMLALVASIAGTVAARQRVPAPM
jgi:hypothetical protein